MYISGSPLQAWLLTNYSLFYDISSLMNLKQYLKLVLSDQSSESDDSSDELPDLEDSDRDSEYSDVDSEDSEYSDVDSEDSEDSDDEEFGPGFINFMNIIFGKLKFLGCLKSNSFFTFLEIKNIVLRKGCSSPRLNSVNL